MDEDGEAVLRETCRMAQVTCFAALKAEEQAETHYYEAFRLYEQAVEDLRRALAAGTADGGER